MLLLPELPHDLLSKGLRVLWWLTGQDAPAQVELFDDVISLLFESDFLSLLLLYEQSFWINEESTLLGAASFASG